MRTVAFILLLITSVAIASSCEPAKQGGYEAPAKGNDGELNGGYSKPDSSVEKAVMHDTVKREYHL